MAVKLINKIKKNLSDDLLSKKFLALKTKNDDLTFGHCYIATETLYHIFGKNKGYKPYVMRVENGKYTHWFLKNNKNHILDPTIDQYQGNTPDYTLAKCTGFLTKRPSKRAQILIKRIKTTEFIRKYD